MRARDFFLGNLRRSVQIVKAPHIVQAHQQFFGHLIHPALLEAQVLAADNRRGEQVEPRCIGTILLDDFHRVGIILQALGHLLAVLGQHDPVDDDMLECVLAKQRSGEHVEVIEPCARLVDALGDKLRRESILKLFFVLERIVAFAVRH